MSDNLSPIVSSANPIAVYPEGRFPGCLPRSSRPGELCPMASERIKVIPRGEWAGLAAQLNNGQGLKPLVPVVLDQDGAGSCATESATGCVMLQRAFSGLPHVLLNPWFVYWHTGGAGDRGDGRSGGSSIDTNLDFIREHGIAPESVWPRSKGWGYRGANKPSEEAYAAALDYRIEEFYDISNIDEMVSALLQGFAVVYGASGHSVLKVRHIDETKGEDLNSWSKDWGPNKDGFGTWAAYRAVNWSYGAWAVRVVQQTKG